MNWQHIEAMLRGTGRFRWAVLNGEHLVTNGAFAMLRGPLTIPECTGEPYPALAKLWLDFSTKLGRPAKVGSHPFKFGVQFCRQIGEEWIDEAYFRCFPEAKWVDGPSRSLIAFVDSQLAAMMMPTGQRGQKLPAMGVSDEDVFGPFCNDRNDWYLIKNEKISAEIGDLLEYIEANEAKIQTAEQENDSYRREIDSLERLAKERNLTPSAKTAPGRTFSN